MKKDIKERVVLYNLNEEEKNLIKNIFLELNIDVNLIKAEDEEDVISSNLVSFIKLPNDEKKRKELEDIYISALRGWQIFYIIDNNFYENIEKIKKQIKECHDDYMRKNKKDSLKYDKILKGNIKEELVENIRTTGYIVDTLEAVFWLFLNSKDYDETVLKAVNLGGDTDTIAAITGGLLGIHYGIENINENWRKKLIKCEYIEKLCDQFYNTIYN